MEAIYGGDILRLCNLVQELNWYALRLGPWNRYTELVLLLAEHALEDAVEQADTVQAEADRLIA